MAHSQSRDCLALFDAQLSIPGIAAGAQPIGSVCVERAFQRQKIVALLDTTEAERGDAHLFQHAIEHQAMGLFPAGKTLQMI